jgi:hypothetical protein
MPEWMRPKLVLGGVGLLGLITDRLVRQISPFDFPYQPH